MTESTKIIIDLSLLPLVAFLRMRGFGLIGLHSSRHLNIIPSMSAVWKCLFRSAHKITFSDMSAHSASATSTTTFTMPCHKIRYRLSIINKLLTFHLGANQSAR